MEYEKLTASAAPVPAPPVLQYIPPPAAAAFLKNILGHGSTSTLAKLRHYGGGPVYYEIGPKRIGYLKPDLLEWAHSRLSAMRHFRAVSTGRLQRLERCFASGGGGSMRTYVNPPKGHPDHDPDFEEGDTIEVFSSDAEREAYDSKKRVPKIFHLDGRGYTDTDDEKANIIADLRAPFEVAKGFIKRDFHKDNVPILYHHCAIFYRWNGSYYDEIKDEDMRAQIYRYLSASFRMNKDGTLQKINPNAAMVSNILDSMRGASWLAATNAPAWLESVGEQLAAEEIVACSNGLLHLPSLKLLPASPKFFTYNALDFAFARRVLKPSQWLAFLDQLWPDDQESIDTLQEFFGYCLTGDTCQQKLFLLVGPKRSGKGTIARVLAKLVGRANSVAPTLAGIGSNFGLAPLIGKRVAIISDARLGGRADQHAITEHLLSITGEDLITIDRKFQAAWTGQLQTRFMIISNELPRLTDSSGALASRFIILLLRNSFYGAEDHGLLAKLSKEMPGGNRRMEPPRVRRTFPPARNIPRCGLAIRRPRQPNRSVPSRKV